MGARGVGSEGPCAGRADPAFRRARGHSIRLGSSQPPSPFFWQQKAFRPVAARAEQLQVVGPVRTALKERDDVVNVPGLFSRLVKHRVARGALAILGIPKSLDILGGMRASRPY